MQLSRPPLFHELRSLPNLLSLVRIAVIPLLVVLLCFDNAIMSLLGATLYGLGAVTDVIDGYLARRMGTTSTMGKLLDPLADKLLVLTSLVMLVDLHRVSAIIVLFVVFRELVVTGIRGIASAEGLVLAANRGVKLKTTFFNFGIGCLILHTYYAPFSLDLHLTGTILLLIGLVFSLSSGYSYVHAFISHRPPSPHDQPPVVRPGD